MSDEAILNTIRVMRRLRDEDVPTLDHLRALDELATREWVHTAEIYHRISEPGCCKRLGENDYRQAHWGGSDCLLTPGATIEDMNHGPDMAFAAAARSAVPLLLDLYEAVLSERPATRNPASSIEIALDRLENWNRAPAPSTEKQQ